MPPARRSQTAPFGFPEAPRVRSRRPGQCFQALPLAAMPQPSPRPAPRGDWLHVQVPSPPCPLQRPSVATERWPQLSSGLSGPVGACWGLSQRPGSAICRPPAHLQGSTPLPGLERLLSSAFASSLLSVSPSSPPEISQNPRRHRLVFFLLFFIFPLHPPPPSVRLCPIAIYTAPSHLFFPLFSLLWPLLASPYFLFLRFSSLVLRIRLNSHIGTFGPWKKRKKKKSRFYKKRIRQIRDKRGQD